MRNLFLTLVLANLAFAAWAAWFAPAQRIGRSTEEGLPSITLVSEVPADLRSTGVVSDETPAEAPVPESPEPDVVVADAAPSEPVAARSHRQAASRNRRVGLVGAGRRSSVGLAVVV